MKRFISLLVITAFVVCALPGVTLAARSGQKGADQSAYEHASDQAIFNRAGDWFSTIGKSEEEKTRILEERKAQEKPFLVKINEGYKHKKPMDIFEENWRAILRFLMANLL